MKQSTMLLLGIGAFLLYQMSKSNGLGRVYLSGMGGIGTIGQGYNINEQVGGDASRYEQAAKFVM